MEYARNNLIRLLTTGSSAYAFAYSKALLPFVNFYDKSTLTFSRNYWGFSIK